jgi:hypothetical protein
MNWFKNFISCVLAKILEKKKLKEFQKREPYVYK